MAKRTKHEAQLENECTEVSYKGKKLEVKYKKLRAVLESEEGQEALDKHCKSTATKFREMFAEIGASIPGAFVAELIWKGLNK